MNKPLTGAGLPARIYGMTVFETALKTGKKEEAPVPKEMTSLEGMSSLLNMSPVAITSQ